MAARSAAGWRARGREEGVREGGVGSWPHLSPLSLMRMSWLRAFQRAVTSPVCAAWSPVGAAAGRAGSRLRPLALTLPAWSPWSCAANSPPPCPFPRPHIIMILTLCPQLPGSTCAFDEMLSLWRACERVLLQEFGHSERKQAGKPMSASCRQRRALKGFHALRRASRSCSAGAGARGLSKRVGNRVWRMQRGDRVVTDCICAEQGGDRDWAH